MQALPDNSTVVAVIEISVMLQEDGDLTTTYGYEGMSKDAAIGHVMVVLDRLRDERKLEWDTCPGCGLPWDEHDAEPDEEDEDDEL